MLAARWARTPVALLFCVCFVAAAQVPPVNPETQQTTAEAEPAAAEEGDQFKSPPGFRPKKHGKHMLYCRSEAVLGTRFKAEKCYDQAGVEELLRAERESKEMTDKINNCAVGTCPVG